MLFAVKVIVTVTLLGEMWLLGAFANVPPSAMETYLVLVSVAWLASPFVALFLAASNKQHQKSQTLALFVAAIVCALAAVSGLLGPWVPALQWVVVIAALVVVGAQNRSHRASESHT